VRLQRWWIMYDVCDPEEWAACDPDKGEYPDPIEQRYELFEFDAAAEEDGVLPNGTKIEYGPHRSEMYRKLRRHVGHNAVIILRCRHADDPDAPTAPVIKVFRSAKDN